MTDAYRACLLCGTRNPYYMLVCRHCGRSLRRAALVGTPPPGTVVPEMAGRHMRLALGVLALLAVAGAVVAGVRMLRGGSFEAAAAAAPAPSPEATETEQERDSWETLEQRLAELPPLPAPSTTLAAASAPAPASAPVPPPSTLLAPTPVPATPAAATPAPRPRASATPRAQEPPTDEEAEDVERDVRAARRQELREAEERVHTLERRAAALRERLREEELTDDERAQIEDDLASSQLQLEDAERALVRAEWALRAVEE